jgi:hypothetical protein
VRVAPANVAPFETRTVERALARDPTFHALSLQHARLSLRANGC